MAAREQVDRPPALAFLDYLPEMFQTHPKSVKRSQILDKLIPDAIDLRDLESCPPLSATDPRKTMAQLKKEFESEIKSDKESR